MSLLRIAGDALRQAAASSGHLAAVCAITMLTVAFAACSDKGPHGYAVADLKALPESELIVPDGEIIWTVGNKGGTLPSYQNTSYTIVVRSDLDADAVFDFYARELRDRGWTFDKAGSQSSSLLEAEGKRGDIDIVLFVANAENASSPEVWGGHKTLYRLGLVAARRKSD